MPVRRLLPPLPDFRDAGGNLPIDPRTWLLCSDRYLLVRPRLPQRPALHPAHPRREMSAGQVGEVVGLRKKAWFLAELWLFDLPLKLPPRVCNFQFVRKRWQYLP